jgi:hypothetical protein
MPGPRTIAWSICFFLDESGTAAKDLFAVDGLAVHADELGRRSAR